MSTKPERWHKTEDDGAPDAHRAVIWIDPDGKEQEGTVNSGRVWFPKGDKMYIYYTPKMWKYVT